MKKKKWFSRLKKAWKVAKPIGGILIAFTPARYAGVAAAVVKAANTVKKAKDTNHAKQIETLDGIQELKRQLEELKRERDKLNEIAGQGLEVE